MRLERVVYWTRDKGEGPPAPELMEPVVTSAHVSSFRKPRIGGLWTSPEGSKYGWEDWCRDNQMEWLGDRYVLAVMGEPRILLIDSAADLERAWKNYGRAREWGKGFEYTDRDLDYRLIADDYDAVWLTAEGHFQARMGMSLNTYAWDCETILWFRWNFASVELCEVAA